MTGNKYRILLVDDQREVIRLLHSALKTLEQKLEIIGFPEIVPEPNNNV